MENSGLCLDMDHTNHNTYLIISNAECHKYQNKMYQKIPENCFHYKI